MRRGRGQVHDLIYGKEVAAQMELGLAGRTVVVTGGSSNIGRGIALAFASEKSNVVIVDVDEVGGQNTVELVRKQDSCGIPGFRRS